MIHTRLLIFFCVLIFGACNPCRNDCENGICLKGTCDCNVWWEGDACEKSVLLPFEGNYVGTIDCEGQVVGTSFKLTVSDNDASKLVLSTGYSLQFVTETRFDVLVSQNGVEEKVGSGEMLVNSISFNSEESDTTQTRICLTTAALDQE